MTNFFLKKRLFNILGEKRFKKLFWVLILQFFAANQILSPANLKEILKSLVHLFNGISTFVGYLMPNQFSKKNSGGAI